MIRDYIKPLLLRKTTFPLCCNIFQPLCQISHSLSASRTKFPEAATQKAGGQFCFSALATHSGRRTHSSDKPAGDLAQGGKSARRKVSTRWSRRPTLKRFLLM